jgi:hypothetical protein
VCLAALVPAPSGGPPATWPIASACALIDKTVARAWDPHFYRRTPIVGAYTIHMSRPG